MQTPVQGALLTPSWLQRTTRLWGEPIATALVGLAVIPLWWLLSQFLFVVPTPWAAAISVWTGLLSGEILMAMSTSFGAVLSALLLSIVVGLAIGIPLGLHTPSRRVLEPLILTMNATPKVIIFPIVLAIFKIGLPANITMGLIHGLFPVLIITMSALKDMPSIYVRVARAANASTMQTVLKVYTPAMILPLVTSIRLAFGLSMVGVVLAEIFASKIGMGRLVMQSLSLSDFPRMTGSLAVLYLVGMGGSWALWRLEQAVSVSYRR